MKKFPKPVELPVSVERARLIRQKEITSASVYGILVRTGIIIMELAGVVFYGSSALLMDAIATSLDVLATVFLIVCIKIAARPPDANHPFGHGRIEPLAGLQMGLLLIVVGIGMFFQQIFEIATVEHTNEIARYLWIIPLIAMVLLELTFRLLRKTAKKHKSTALQVDASHYLVDSVSSFLALIALLLGAFFPELSRTFDHIGAFAIVIFMVTIGLMAMRENVNQLVDKAPSPELFAKVRKAASKVAGVLGTEKIRIQTYGPDAHVDIDIEVDPDLSVEKAHKISQNTRAAIQKEWPFVRDVIVHIEPFYPGDH